ncbi:MAG: hypothetical protein ACFE0R_09130 [Salinarimonas sp.]
MAATGGADLAERPLETLPGGRRPGALLTQARVRSVFRVESRILEDPVHGCPPVIPIGAAPRETVVA